MIYIYKITNTVNSNIYIGQTVNISKRWSDHKSSKKNHPLYNAMKKYGVENFKFEVLCEMEDQEEVNNLEINLIYKFDSTNREKGYNLDLGGNGAGKHSDETKLKISESNKGRNKGRIPHNKGKKTSEEIKRKISLANKGRISPNKGKKGQIAHNKGKKTSEEIKKKISASVKKSMTDEVRKKISDSKKNPSEETRKKLSESHKGKKTSEETKQKLSNLNKTTTEEQENNIYDLYMSGNYTKSDISRLFNIGLNVIYRILKQKEAA